MTPERMEAIATAIATAHSGVFKMQVIKGAELVSAGMHLMAAVGQSSRHQARYITLEYTPADLSGVPEHKVAVVGKGITFDSGGLNIKGTGFMEGE